MGSCVVVVVCCRAVTITPKKSSTSTQGFISLKRMLIFLQIYNNGIFWTIFICPIQIAVTFLLFVLRMMLVETNVFRLIKILLELYFVNLELAWLMHYRIIGSCIVYECNCPAGTQRHCFKHKKNWGWEVGNQFGDKNYALFHHFLHSLWWVLVWFLEPNESLLSLSKHQC